MVLSSPFGNRVAESPSPYNTIATCGAGFALSVTWPLITPVFVGCAVGGVFDCADNVEAAAGSSSIKARITRYFIDLLRDHTARPKSALNLILTVALSPITTWLGAAIG